MKIYQKNFYYQLINKKYRLCSGQLKTLKIMNYITKSI